jgi:hypothetical protein
MRFVGLLICLLAFPAWADITVPDGQSGYVYGTNSGILRRVIIAGPGSSAAVPTSPGETGVVQPPGSPADEVSINAAITTAIGKPIAVSRCAIVTGGNPAHHSGTVVNIKSCDPDLDSDPSSHFQPSLTAQVGDQWTGTSFLRPFAIVDPVSFVVLQIALLDIDNPIPPIAGALIMPAGSKKAGDPVPKKKKG